MASERGQLGARPPVRSGEVSSGRSGSPDTSGGTAGGVAAVDGGPGGSAAATVAPAESGSPAARRRRRTDARYDAGRTIRTTQTTRVAAETKMAVVTTR